MSRESNYDHMISVFSPQGRLYQIEYAFKAATSGGNTGVAVRGASSVAVVTQRKVPDRLLDPTTIRSIFPITDKIGCLLIGLTPDVMAQVQRLRYESTEYRFQYGYDMPPHVLAQRIADISQTYTQEASLRPMAVYILLVAMDEEKGPQLFRIDPAGHFLPYKAASIGTREQEATNFLERRVEQLTTMDDAATVQLAIQAMQSVLATDFKGSELEVGVVTQDASFRTLSAAEVEDHLNAIAAGSDA
mmetsp:Transcript_7477/g.25287  ORF Transcript_7477/g.25287 Transcript_7477/m.25287 type:complete len:246 (+) Transcript_7477:95-832(+)